MSVSNVILPPENQRLTCLPEGLYDEEEEPLYPVGTIVQCGLCQNWYVYREGDQYGGYWIRVRWWHILSKIRISNYLYKDE